MAWIIERCLEKDPRRRYPVLQMIHGGPYAAAGDTFGFDAARQKLVYKHEGPAAAITPHERNMQAWESNSNR